MVLKICPKCRVGQPLENFGRHKGTKDGLQQWCRACDAAYHHEAYHNPSHPAHESRVRNAWLSSKAAAVKMILPEHPYTWGNRERDWRRRGILCLFNCRKNKGFLCREHYIKCWELQGGRCGICGGLITRGLKPYPSADHYHSQGKFGPFRGILHGGKIGCNIRLLGAYERGKFPVSVDLADPLVEAMRAYLRCPPAARLADHEYQPRYASYSASFI